MARKRIPIAIRFFAKVYMSLDSHWYWIGAGNKKGYGHIWDADSGRQRMAHQVSFELHGGVIPADYEIDHLCRIPACVNPRHLRAVTHHVNMLAGFGPLQTNARKTHCIRGHAFDDTNTQIRYRNGHIARRCQRCIYERDRSHQHVCRICNEPFVGRRKTTVCGKKCLSALLSHIQYHRTDRQLSRMR